MGNVIPGERLFSFSLPRNLLVSNPVLGALACLLSSWAPNVMLIALGAQHRCPQC